MARLIPGTSGISGISWSDTSTSHNDFVWSKLTIESPNIDYLDSILDKEEIGDILASYISGKFEDAEVSYLRWKDYIEPAGIVLKINEKENFSDY